MSLYSKSADSKCVDVASDMRQSLPKGVPLTKPTDVIQIWWMQLTLQVEIKIATMAMAIMVEVVRLGIYCPPCH